MAKKRKKMGRPRFVVDWDLVDGMCEIQCTAAEIASVLGCNPNTLAAATKREHGVTFPEYFEQKRGIGKESLRRAQYKNATDKNNATMQIWLGKQWLNQKDRSEVHQTITHEDWLKELD